MLVPRRRLKRSILCPNHYLYNVWATSQKSVARRISGRQKRSDGCHNSVAKKRYKTCVVLMMLMCSRCQEWSFCWFELGFTDVSWNLIWGLLKGLRTNGFSWFAGVRFCFILLWFLNGCGVLRWSERVEFWSSRVFLSKSRQSSFDVLRASFWGLGKGQNHEIAWFQKCCIFLGNIDNLVLLRCHLDGAALHFH